MNQAKPKKEPNEISRIVHAIRRSVMTQLPMPRMGAVHQKMTMPQIHVMTTLVEKEPLTMRDLATSSGVAMPSMTDMINRLVRQNLVERTRGESDRRTIHVRLTTKGKKVIHHFHKGAGDKLDELFDHLTVQEKNKVIEGLKILERLVCNDNIMTALKKRTKKRGFDT